VVEDKAVFLAVHAIGRLLQVTRSEEQTRRGRESQNKLKTKERIELCKRESRLRGTTSVNKSFKNRSSENDFVEREALSF